MGSPFAVQKIVLPRALSCLISIPLLAVLFLTPYDARSQSWRPSKRIEIITGTGAGSDLDRAARAISQIAGEKNLLGANSIVLNKPGANSAIAWEYVNSQQAQGSIIAISSPPLITNPMLGVSKLSYRDFTPLAKLYDVYMCLVVKADSPVSTIADLLGRARKTGKSSWALTGGTGSIPHILLVQLLKASRLAANSVAIVHYKAAGDMMAALLGGHVELVSSTIPNVLPAVKNGQVRVLAVAAPRRLLGAMATAPTLEEAGFKIVSSNWRGVIGPPALKKDHVAYWDTVLSAVTASEQWKEVTSKFFWETDYLGSVKTKIFLETQEKELGATLREAGIDKN